MISIKRRVSDYMGGSGSGNGYRFDSKTVAEQCCSIDVRQLSRWGYLKPWLKYPLKWNNGSNIVIETNPGTIELFYGISVMSSCVKMCTSQFSVLVIL